MDNENQISTETVQQEQQEQPQEKLFTQSEVDKIVQKRLAKENAKFEERLNALEQSQKLAQMSEQEKKEFEYQQRLDALTEREKAINERETAYNRQQYKVEIQRQLQENGLPDMSDLLIGMEAEQVKAQIDIMKQSFTQSVNQQVETRIKATGQVPVANERQVQLMTLEQIQALSVDEYNANKELVEQSLKQLQKK